MSIYIKAAEQISIQQPLSTEWMTNPIVPTEAYSRAIDPVFKNCLSPAESRRLGLLLKRAQTTALSIEKQTGIKEVDAVLVGTGLGCMENTEKLLNSLVNDGEQLFSPTLFMQSTHNTIASHLAIHSKSHGYNITYAHKDVSFDLALYDAWMQFRLGKIKTALVGGFDEITPSYFKLLEKIGYFRKEMMGPGSEAATNILLSSEADASLCELAAMRIVYKADSAKLLDTLETILHESKLQKEEISAVVLGTNGNKNNDRFYDFLLSSLNLELPQITYKQLFGTSYTASSYAVYVAAHCLAKGFVPGHMANCQINNPKALLLLNHSDGKEYSFIILKSLC